jgi:anti-sigma-K factor RskA
MALRQDLHSLAGPYALDALDSGAEQDRFERHLNRCQNCATEVRGFRETATRLGMADDHARHARPAARARPLPRLAMVAGALAAAAAIVLAIVLVNTQHQLNQARHQLSQAQEQLAAITAVQTATDAKVITKRTSVGGTVTVTSSASRRQLVLTTSELPPLTAGKVYQLWLIGKAPNKIRSEGLLASPHNGRTGPVLVSGILAGDTLGVSVQQAGGAIQPTIKAVIVLVPAS